MARSKNVTKKQRVYPPVSKEDHVRCLIKYSERAITGQGTGVDVFFEAQVEKLKKRLKSLEKVK